MNLVGVFTSENIQKQFNVLKKYKQYIYAVEIRVDTFYPDLKNINKIILQIKKILPKTKIILTFRTYKEGGKTKANESQRKKVIFYLLKENFKYIDIVDIEYKSGIKNEIAKIVYKYKKHLILSCHFTNEISKTNLSKLLDSLSKFVRYFKPKPIVKIVIKSDRFKHYFALLKEALKYKLKLTLFTIGKTSLLSRSVSLLLNMPAVYASIIKPVIKTQPDIPKTINLAKKLGIIS